MAASYCTIDRDVGGVAGAEIEVRRSRFLAQARRVETEAQARDFIAHVRAQHRDARHHCTAFVIGPTAQLQRSNDDGEPSGTAGRPMLDAITGRGLSDVVVVVTRWFGGVLLGTGGLARAYSDATAAALDVAGARTRVLRPTATVQVAMAEAGSLQHRLRQVAEVTDVRYADRVEIDLVAPSLDDVERVLSPLSARLVPGDPVWSDE